MLIENRFQDWLEYDDMWQYDIDPAHWYNKRFRISFFHDFKKSRRLKNQLDAVTEKYNRRIKRFFIAISEPTLFIRYIYNQKEADFISKNFKNIENSLKKYNRQNQIIYISNAEIETDFKTFAVKQDDGDNVARRFLEKSDSLFSLLESKIYNVQKREHNLAVINKKQKAKFRLRYYLKLKKNFDKYCVKPVWHDKLYKEPKREFGAANEFKLL